MGVKPNLPYPHFEKQEGIRHKILEAIGKARVRTRILKMELSTQHPWEEISVKLASLINKKGLLIEKEIILLILRENVSV